MAVHVDKTDETELQRAVERASELLLRRCHGGAASVADYTSRACTESFPGHYAIYWPLHEMEEALDMSYRVGRVVDGTIGPLEIRVVRAGTFEELMEHAVSRGASIGQYKVPRCVTLLEPVIELLDSRVVS